MLFEDVGPSKEYLFQLQIRRKWIRETRTLLLNDIRFICNEATVRNKLPSARVIDLLPGRDGKIRPVCLQTSKEIGTRPVQKLHLFESLRSETPPENRIFQIGQSMHLKCS